MTKRNRLLVDRDKLNHASKSNVASRCVDIFDRIQGWPKELQLLSLAAAFLLSADASGYPAQDAFTAVKNLMADPMTSSGLAPQFQAMRYHLNTEVLADD
jgi:hypothetical protein